MSLGLWHGSLDLSQHILSCTTQSKNKIKISRNNQVNPTSCFLLFSICIRYSLLSHLISYFCFSNLSLYYWLNFFFLLESYFFPPLHAQGLLLDLCSDLMGSYVVPEITPGWAAFKTNTLTSVIFLQTLNAYLLLLG